MKVSRLQAGLIGLLIVLLAGTTSALSSDDQLIRDSLPCYQDDDLIQEDYGRTNATDRSLPDFVPDVSAPRIVKLERDNKILIRDVSFLISNQGTADHIYDKVLDNYILCIAEVGSHQRSEEIKQSISAGEEKSVLSISLEAPASDFGIDPSGYQLPLDVEIEVTVNPDRTIEELDYQNNQIIFPVRITAPDLAVEIVAPRYTTPASETAIGIRVTNLGEVGSNAAKLVYGITGKRDTTINVPALGSNESTMLWQNSTLAAREYTVSAEINPDGASDYETAFSNNHANATISSDYNPTTHIDLPQDIVLVPGTTYDLLITVTSVSNLAECQVNLAFNGSILEVENVTSGSLEIVAKEIGDGWVRFNSAPSSGVCGDVTIATIKFNVTGTTGDTTPLNLDAELLDLNAFPIPVEVVPGSVHLLLYGDANGDGRVDQADTLCVLRWVVGLGLGSRPVSGTPEFLVTDVNQNGIIDVGDAMLIAQYNAKLRDVYFRLQ
jgi:hypothetical protein